MLPLCFARLEFKVYIGLQRTTFFELAVYIYYIREYKEFLVPLSRFPTRPLRLPTQTYFVHIDISSKMYFLVRSILHEGEVHVLTGVHSENLQ